MQLEAAVAGIVSAEGGSRNGANLDTVSLSEVMVSLMSAKSMYSTDLSTLRTAEQIQKTTIDLIT